MNRLAALPATALALLLALLLAQCQTSTPAPTPPPSQLSLLPPATMSGLRTFGCLVNGQAWTPAGDPFAGPLLTVQYDFRDSTLAITAIRNGNFNNIPTRQVISLVADKVIKAGQFKLFGYAKSYADYENLESNCTYRTDPTHVATLNLTRFDRVNRVVSGTFAFTLEPPGCGKVDVNYGRFDAPY